MCVAKKAEKIVEDNSKRPRRSNSDWWNAIWKHYVFPCKKVFERSIIV